MLQNTTYLIAKGDRLGDLASRWKQCKVDITMEEIHTQEVYPNKELFARLPSFVVLFELFSMGSHSS